MKTKYFITILLILIGIDIYLTYILLDDFDENLVTRDWFCLEWMAIVTEAGMGLTWYKLTKRTL